MKNYLEYENARNRTWATLYTRVLERALARDKGSIAILIGHHLTFEVAGDITTENEIPSADTMMFDHEIMTAVFGERAVMVMKALAAVPCAERDHLLMVYMGAYCE